jgi:uncharacterized protein (TIGR02611 family)
MKTTVSNPTERKEPAVAAFVRAGYGPSLLKKARRVVVFVLGVSVVAVGIVMIVAPGPAIVVIPMGLAILATEFLWARRLLDSLKRRLADAHAATAQAPLPRWLRFLLPKKNGDA